MPAQPTTTTQSNDRWMRLSVLMYNGGTGAMLQLFHQVMPKDPMQLYAELNKLLNTRTRNATVKKGFTNIELGLLLPTNLYFF